MRPFDANSTKKVLRLPEDNFATPQFWIQTDGYEVVLVEQRSGEPTKQAVTIPRNAFNRLVEWYMQDQ